MSQLPFDSVEGLLQIFVPADVSGAGRPVSSRVGGIGPPVVVASGRQCPGCSPRLLDRRQGVADDLGQVVDLGVERPFGLSSSLPDAGELSEHPVVLAVSERWFRRSGRAADRPAIPSGSSAGPASSEPLDN